MRSLLVAKGEKIDTKNDRSQASSWRAARRGPLKTATVLVKRGADIDDADVYFP